MTDKNNNELRVRRYQRLLESTKAIPWQVDGKTLRFTYIGPQIEAAMGYPSDAWLAPNFWVDHMHPDDRQWAVAFCRDSTARGEDHEFEYRMIAADGRVVWLRDIVNVIHDERGSCTLQGFMFDITARKQTENILATLAGTTSSLDIEQFYKTCVQKLATVYDAKFAFIGLLLDSGEDVGTAAVWAGDQYAENFQYNLEGTPCKDILDEKIELISCDAAKRYPQDTLLADMGIDSYFGAPLVSYEGHNIGLVAVMDVKPMELNNRTASILGVFARRIAVETERHVAADKLRYSQNALTQAQRIAGIGSFEWDQGAARVYWSQQALELMQWPETNTVTATLAPFLASVHPADQERVEQVLQNIIARGEQQAIEHRLLLSDGAIRYVEFRAHYFSDAQRQTKVMVGTIHDITARYAQQAELERLVNYDALTDLPNRLLLRKTLADRIQMAATRRCKFALALLDLDGFKEINNALGHNAGDQLLRQLGPRLEAATEPGDFIARLGGDEFGVLINDITSEDEAVKRLAAIREVFNHPFLLDGTKIFIGVSIGLSVYPGHSDDAGNLLRFADVAMYQAKRAMTGYAVYDPGRDPYGPRRLALRSDINEALERNELVLHYQPKIVVGSKMLHAVEALVRWNHPRHGLIQPGEFIALCEVSGLIHNVTDHVMTSAINEVNSWQHRCGKIKVAVNISARDLMDGDLAQRVTRVLDYTHADPEMLTLEITENDLMHDPDRARQSIQSLCRLGVGFSIDDFGTGYSSLSYLKNLRVQELKIDKSFVRDIAIDDNDAMIVKSTIDMAHNLGLEVTAEGVENADTLLRLGEYGCELAQGYYIAKPCPASEMLEWLSCA